MTDRRSKEEDGVYVRPGYCTLRMIQSSPATLAARSTTRPHALHLKLCHVPPSRRGILAAGTNIECGMMSTDLPRRPSHSTHGSIFNCPFLIRPPVKSPADSA